MWAILRPTKKSSGILLGSWWTSSEDDLEGFFSLYNAPNEVIWRIKKPTTHLAKYLNYDDIIKLVCFRRTVATPRKGNEEFDILKMLAQNDPNIVIDINLAIVSKNWHQGKRKKNDSLEIRMIPNAKSIVKNNSHLLFFGGKKYDGRYKLSEIFREIEKGTGNQLRILSNPTTDAIEYKNFIGFSDPLDTVDKISNDNILEYFYRSDELFIGKMVTNNLLGQAVPPLHTYPKTPQYVNTVFTYNFKWIEPLKKKKPMIVEVFSGGYPDILPLPGTEIDMLGKGTRVVYLNLNFGQKVGASSIFVTVETIAVPKELLYDLMPEKGRQKLSMEYRYRYPNVVYGDIKSYVEFPEGETIRRQVDLNLIYRRHDPENMCFQNLPENPILFESFPYAGNEVGVQYPKNVSGKVIAIAPDGKYESSTIVGQMFQNNKMPKRNSISDYRLTLPNDATDYYSEQDMSWVRSTKSELGMGTYSSLSHGTGHALDVMDNYIKIKEEDNGNIYMAVGCNIGGMYPERYIRINYNSGITISHRDKEIFLSNTGVKITSDTNFIDMNDDSIEMSDGLNSLYIDMDEFHMTDGTSTIIMSDNGVEITGFKEGSNYRYVHIGGNSVNVR